MKKIGVIAIVVVVLGGGLALVVWTRPHKAGAPDKSSQTASQTSKDSASKTKAACSVLTLDDAKKLLGDTAIAGSSNSDTPTESDALTVSTCTFIQDTGDSTDAIKDAKTASLLMRAPKNRQGTDSNKNQFGSAKPAGVTDVSGYGDAAYWDPQYSQLNILKSDTWYILSYGVTTVSGRTLDETKQLADLIAPRL